MLSSKQQLDHCLVPVGSGPPQRRLTVLVPGLHVGLIKQQLHHRFVPLLGSPPQGAFLMRADVAQSPPERLSDMLLDGREPGYEAARLGVGLGVGVTVIPRWTGQRLSA